MKTIQITAVLFSILLMAGSGTTLWAQEDWETGYQEMVDAKTVSPYLETKILSHEISILNLLNGLYLTPKQMEKIMVLSSQARSLIGSALKKHRKKVKEFQNTLEELKAILEDPDRTIPQGIEEKVQVKEHEINEVKHQVKQGLKSLEDALLRELTQSQLEVVREFAPCLIPPQNLKDPVRVGQAEGEQGELEMHMEHIRNLPEKPYQAVIDPLLMKMIDEWNPIFNYTSSQKEAELKRLRGIVDEARQLDDAEFALRKTDLARRVMQKFTDFHDQANHISDFFAQMGELSKAGKWLLNPRIIPILKERLKHPARYTATCKTCKKPELVCSDPQSCGSQSESDPEAGFCPCGNPTFGWFCSRFSIAAEEREACREILAKGQIRLLNLLSEKAEDGKAPLAVMFTEPEKFEAYLFQPIPNGNETYLKTAESITQEIREGLMEHMSRIGIKEFVKADVDLFEIHVGNLNKFE